jgi:hypothetical protein
MLSALVAGCQAPVASAPIDRERIEAYLGAYEALARLEPEALRALNLEAATPTGPAARSFDRIAREYGFSGMGELLRTHAKVAAIAAIIEGRVLIDSGGAYFDPGLPIEGRETESGKPSPSRASPGSQDPKRKGSGSNMRVVEESASLSLWAALAPEVERHWRERGGYETALRAAARATTQTVSLEEFLAVMRAADEIARAYRALPKPEAFIVDVEG